jgi:hypothetical protein
MTDEERAESDAWLKFIVDGCPGLEGRELFYAKQLAWPKPEHICANGHLHGDAGKLIRLSGLLWGATDELCPEIATDAEEFRALLLTSKHLQKQVGILVDNAANEVNNWRGIVARSLRARADEIERSPCAFPNANKAT